MLWENTQRFIVQLCDRSFKGWNKVSFTLLDVEEKLKQRPIICHSNKSDSVPLKDFKINKSLWSAIISFTFVLLNVFYGGGLENNTKRSWKRLLQAERRKGQGKQFKLSSLCPGGRPWVKNSSCITCSPSSLCETVTFHAACSTGCQPLKPRVVRRVSNACPPMWSSLLCEYTCSTPSSLVSCHRRVTCFVSP